MNREQFLSKSMSLRNVCLNANFEHKLDSLIGHHLGLEFENFYREYFTQELKDNGTYSVMMLEYSKMYREYILESFLAMVYDYKLYRKKITVIQ